MTLKYVLFVNRHTISIRSKTVNELKRPYRTRFDTPLFFPATETIRGVVDTSFSRQKFIFLPSFRGVDTTLCRGRFPVQTQLSWAHGKIPWQTEWDHLGYLWRTIYRIVNYVPEHSFREGLFLNEIHFVLRAACCEFSNTTSTLSLTLRFVT